MSITSRAWAGLGGHHGHPDLGAAVQVVRADLGDADLEPAQRRDDRAQVGTLLPSASGSRRAAAGRKRGLGIHQRVRLRRRPARSAGFRATTTSRSMPWSTRWPSSSYATSSRPLATRMSSASLPRGRPWCSRTGRWRRRGAAAAATAARPAPAGPAGGGTCRPRRRSCRARRRTAGRRPGTSTSAARSSPPAAWCRRCSTVSRCTAPALWSSLLAASVTSRRRATQLALPAHRDQLGGVLEPLALEPGLQEQRVRLDVLAVELDADGVVAVHQRLVERGAAAAQRVAARRGGRRASGGGGGGQQREVEQQLGELLVGLAGVLRDGDQVAVVAGQRAERDRPQQVVVDPLEQGVGRRHVGQVGDVRAAAGRRRRSGTPPRRSPRRRRP